jgi:choline-sulfatase
MLTSLFRPHYPLRAEADLFEEALARTAEPDTAPGPDAMHPVNRQILRHYGLEEVSPETARRARAAYFAMIAELDRRIGNIMNTLEETGLAENTIVVYTSDHGDMAGEHGLFFKVTLYDESSKVPLLVRVPGQAPARIDEPASLVDLMPTLSDLCGLPLETVTDGHSLAAGITGGDPGRDEPVICEFYGEALRGPIRMLRQGRYKLNWYHGYGPELFDLEADPRERSNLAEDPDYADILDRLRQRLFDGWDPEAMRRRVLSDQHDMALIDAARRRTREAGGFRANGQPLPHLPDQTEPTF